jgi:hypothetical protein
MKNQDSFKKSKSALRKAADDLDEWLNDETNNVIFDRRQSEFAEELAMSEPNRLDCVYFIWNFLASRGMQSLLKGSNGWHDVHRAWRGEFFNMRVGMYHFERVRQEEQSKPRPKEPSLWKRLNDVLEGNRPPLPKPALPILDGHTIAVAARMWAYAEVCNQTREADYLMRVVHTFLPRLTPRQLGRRRLDPFLLWIWQKKMVKNGPVELLSDVDYRAYHSIIKAWDDPYLLESSITEACEYHCQRMFDSDDYPEFSHMPYAFVPVEILVIYKIRDELGLETPKVHHPLLATPCSKIQGSPCDVQDELLAKAERKLTLLWTQLRDPIVRW